MSQPLHSLCNTYVIHANEQDPASIQPAVDLLKQEQVVAIPTETVYGLAANALSLNATRKIFAAKNRPSDNPLICHISSREMLPMLVDNSIPIPDAAVKLMDAFWPGPLTILFKKNEFVPDEVTCGHPTVGIRMPSHPIALKIIEMCGFPLAAPSANASGRPSPTKAEHVMHDLRGLIPCIVDGGASDCGVESTVVDVCFGISKKPVVLRPGGITIEELRTILPDIIVHGKDFTEKFLEERPSTPGMKYKHYTPNATVILVERSIVNDNGDANFNLPAIAQNSAVVTEIMKLQKQSLSVKGNTLAIGILTTSNSSYENCILNAQHVRLIHRSMGSVNDLKGVAQELFAGLRDLDAQNANYIIVEGVGEEHEGLAVMNRLRKAASFIVKGH